MEYINQKDKSSELGLNIEKREIGVCYVISTKNKIELENIIIKIADFFDEPKFLHKEIISTIVDQKKDWRFENTFNIKVSENMLTIDNRNGRGNNLIRARLENLMEQLTNKNL